MPGNAEDFPMERLKKRIVSYISVGGATTDNWTSMGTASLHLFGFPPMMKVMGNYNANSMGTVGNPYLDDQLIADMHETVECPVCGIEGELSIKDNAVHVEFSEAQQNRARGTFAGLREHTTEIQSFGGICGPKIMANKEKLDALMDERIKKFDETVNR